MLKVNFYSPTAAIFKRLTFQQMIARWPPRRLDFRNTEAVASWWPSALRHYVVSWGQEFLSTRCTPPPKSWTFFKYLLTVQLLFCNCFFSAQSLNFMFHTDKNHILVDKYLLILFFFPLNVDLKAGKCRCTKTKYTWISL